jgi:hypothetical protein
VPKQQRHTAPGSAGRSTLQENLDRALAPLDKLNIAALRDLWRRRFRSAPPPIQSRDVLRRLFAWKLQVEAFGDCDEATLVKIRRLVRSGGRGSAAFATANLKSGAILVREWHGVEHRVLVLDRGFEHKDKRYKSLSEVARAITGTRWSGPRFFGLESKREHPRVRP